MRNYEVKQGKMSERGCLYPDRPVMIELRHGTRESAKRSGSEGEDDYTTSST